MSILDIDIDGAPTFSISDTVRQYLEDTDLFVDKKLPFEYIGGVATPIGTNNYEPSDDDVLINDSQLNWYYHVDAYYFTSPRYLGFGNSRYPGFPPNHVTEIKEQVSSGIYKRVTWGHIKKHFNLK